MAQCEVDYTVAVAERCNLYRAAIVECPVCKRRGVIRVYQRGRYYGIIHKATVEEGCPPTAVEICSYRCKVRPDWDR